MEILAIILVLYFVPTYIALVREHKNLAPIIITNLFFGWTFLGWVIALAWAFSSNVKEIKG